MTFLVAYRALREEEMMLKGLDGYEDYNRKVK
jgi:protein-S-isoprenylcysteine O-methyltransferase Ste14